MQKLMQKHRKFMRGDAGFSLVELIIVIAIMAALVAIVAPQYLKYVEKSKQTADKDTAASIISCAKIIATDSTIATGTFSLTWDKDADGPIVIADGLDGAQTQVNDIMGAIVAKPRSTTLVTTDYTVTATYDSTNITWTFTENLDLSSLGATD